MLQFGTVEAVVSKNEPSLRGVYAIRIIVSDMSKGDLREAAELVADAKYLIALTGAGVSKESNVPTFRGEDGLWRNYNAMELATPSAFANNPELVWEWYTWRQGLIAECEPNPGHLTLAKWETAGLLKSLITQNVDGLHRRAGSSNVFEVHGNLWALKCTSCNHHDRLSTPAEGIPECPECGSMLRPDVVWFGESLDSEVMAKVYAELGKATVCLVIGTSGIVQPAAMFPIMVKQKRGTLIEFNVEASRLTRSVDYHIQGPSGETLPALDSLI